MSAIVGIVGHDGRDGANSAQSVATALDAMRRRGPDGTGTWIGESAALGYAHRISTTESVGEKQPVQDAGLTVVADARLDNRRELLRWLELSPAATDGEIILHAFQKADLACVDRLVGPFAFIVWHETARRLVCARDHQTLPATQLSRQPFRRPALEISFGLV